MQEDEGVDPVVIRPYRADADHRFLVHGIQLLQETERGIDPRLPPGEAVVDACIAELFRRLTACDGRIGVAEVDGTAVGFVTLLLRVPETEPDEPTGTFALISDLFVTPEARRRGIGAALLSWAEAEARLADVPVIRLEVLAGNHPARRFYALHGWRDRLVQLEK